MLVIASIDGYEGGIKALDKYDVTIIQVNLARCSDYLKKKNEDIGNRASGQEYVLPDNMLYNIGLDTSYTSLVCLSSSNWVFSIPSNQNDVSSWTRLVHRLGSYSDDDTSDLPVAIVWPVAQGALSSKLPYSASAPFSCANALPAMLYSGGDPLEGLEDEVYPKSLKILRQVTMLRYMHDSDDVYNKEGFIRLTENIPKYLCLVMMTHNLYIHE